VENTEAIYVLSKATLTVLCLRSDDDGLCGLRVGGGAGNVRGLVPSLIEGLRVVQGLRVVPVFVYRYSMIN
jgi:hypothetical protein